jgi:putative ABC transport system permease protein
MDRTPRIPGLRRVFHLSGARRVQTDVDEELRFHLDMRAEELVRRGLSPEAAQAQAAREFGDIGSARTELAEIDRRRTARAGRSEWWASLWHDVRYAARGLHARPGFTTVVLLTLALGIGANTAIFTVVDAALLRSLPYPEADRLVHLWESSPTGTDRAEASYPDFVDWQRSQSVFEGLGGYQTNAVALTGRDVPLMVLVTYVTPGFFDVLRVRAAVGRTFHEGHDRIGDRVAVLGDGFWQRELGGDPRVVGQTITLGGTPHTVIGVLPSDFHFARAEGGGLWAITDLGRPYMNRRGVHWLNTIARMNDGVTLPQARAAMSAVARGIAERHPDTHTGRSAAVVPLRDEFVKGIRPLLLVLLSAVSLVLLVACANVAGLLMARASARQQELAVRAALGAGRARIVQQLLSESVLLATLGGALGLLVAHVGVRALVNALPEPQRLMMPYLVQLGVDLRVLGYALLVALATGVLFGLVPAVPASRPALAPTLRAVGRTTAGRRRTARNALVIGEFALTLVLLVGAGLLTQSLVRLLRIDPGFRPQRILTAAVLLPQAKYPDSTRIRAFFNELVTRTRALPGVTAVGLTSKLPLDWGNSMSYVVGGRPLPPPGERPGASVREVSTGYFDTMGIPLIDGRDFTEQDGANAPRVVIVNQAVAAQQFGVKSAVGERIAFDIEGRGPFYTVVGVVGNVPIAQLDETPTPTIYFPHQQRDENGMFLVARTAGDPAKVASAVRGVVRSLDPDLPVALVSTMERNIANSQSVFMRRYSMLLVGGFALLALVLSIVGMYGVISYGVVQRTQELGVRVALGAQRWDIIAMILRDGALLAAAGIVIGSVTALWLTRFLRSLLFGIQTTDPLTYVAVATLLAGVALVASYLPARRATRVDPLIALRGAE